MAYVRILEDFKNTNDDQSVCTGGSVKVYVAGTAQAVQQPAYADRNGDVTLGYNISTGSLGYPVNNGNFTELWVPDDVSIDIVITNDDGSRTYEYYRVASSTAAEDTGARPAFKNMVANGNLALWSYGTSFANISGSGAKVEVADGIYFAQGGSASNAVSRQTAGGTGARYALRFGRPSSSTSTDKLRIFGSISTDEAIRARSQSITISIGLKKGADFSGTGIAVLVATGTGTGEDPVNLEAGGWTGQSNIVSTTQGGLTTSNVRFQFTGAVGANVNEIGWQIAFTGVGTASTNDWAEIEDIVVEIGTSASTIEQPPAIIEYDRLHPRNAYGTTIASASSIDLGKATGDTVDVSGTTTITALGTATAGIRKDVRFTGAVQLTHNGTSLILPGAANITTVANDTAEFVSLGSGNWRCTRYTRMSSAPISLTAINTWAAAQRSVANPISSNAAGFNLSDTGFLEITANGAPCGFFNRKTDDGDIIRLYQDGTQEGTISVSGTTIAYNTFLGSHWSQFIDRSTPDILPGTIMETVDELCWWDEPKANDRLPCVKVSDEAGASSVYGVFLAWDREDGGCDMMVASLGAGHVRVAAGVTVKRGDLIESNGDGCGRVQADDVMRSRTVAKVTAAVRVREYPDGSYLVPATLHCG